MTQADNSPLKIPYRNIKPYIESILKKIRSHPSVVEELNVYDSICLLPGLELSEFAKCMTAYFSVYHSVIYYPVQKNTFEHFFASTLNHLDVKAELTRSPQVQYDVQVELQGKIYLYSLKTTSEQRLRISKFAEARWLRTPYERDELCRRTRQAILDHLESYHYILFLRIDFRPPCVKYYLIQINVQELKRSVERLSPDDFRQARGPNRSFTASIILESELQCKAIDNNEIVIRLDRSVEKITIDRLPIVRPLCENLLSFCIRLPPNRAS